MNTLSPILAFRPSGYNRNWAMCWTLMALSVEVSLPCRPPIGPSGHYFFQGPDASPVFLRGADRDAEPFRQFIAAHGARDHSAFLKLVGDLLAVADVDQNEIRSRRYAGNTEA